jgi:hypothetical protein
MNIFVLDKNPYKCVVQYPDAHVVKMITESVQMLSTNLRLHKVSVGYKITHENHPCTKWARESFSNMLWLRKLVEAMHKEWQFRYDHKHNHKAYDVFLSLPLAEVFPKIGFTPFVQCMPEKYRHQNIIEAYRRFYIGEKSHLERYTKRQKPTWFGG